MSGRTAGGAGGRFTDPCRGGDSPSFETDRRPSNTTERPPSEDAERSGWVVSVTLLFISCGFIAPRVLHRRQTRLPQSSMNTVKSRHQPSPNEGSLLDLLGGSFVVQVPDRGKNGIVLPPAEPIVVSATGQADPEPGWITTGDATAHPPLPANNQDARRAIPGWLFGDNHETPPVGICSV